MGGEKRKEGVGEREREKGEFENVLKNFH